MKHGGLIPWNVIVFCEIVHPAIDALLHLLARWKNKGGHGPLAGMAPACVPTKQLRKRLGENKKEGRQPRDACTGRLQSSWAWDTVDERNRSKLDGLRLIGAADKRHLTIPTVVSQLIVKGATERVVQGMQELEKDFVQLQRDPSVHPEHMPGANRAVNALGCRNGVLLCVRASVHRNASLMEWVRAAHPECAMRSSYQVAVQRSYNMKTNGSSSS